MSIGPGWAEFNDANAIIRGRLVAASGTFSGTFSADNIDAVGDVNIKGNAVSTYYGFTFAENSKSVEFVVPAQQYAKIVDIKIPMIVDAWGEGTGVAGSATLYKNGVAIRTDPIYVPTDATYLVNHQRDWYDCGYIPAMQVLRIIDFDVSATSNTTYKIVVKDGGWGAWNGTYWNYDDSKNGYTVVRLLGSVVVGCRKR